MTATATPPAADGKKKPAPPPDRVRESIETVVFVVVLVLLLKLFVTEAFVIPTGSMAETLYGYQKVITCPRCGHEFPVNSHDEVEPNQATNERHRLLQYTCPNCRYLGPVSELSPYPQNRTGDRVLVLKPIYHLQAPHRGDVVVFKYPKEPQVKQTAQNYIKRCQGFGGETVGVHRGDLYTTRALDYPADARDEYGNVLYPRPDDPADLWRPRYAYSNTTHNQQNPAAVKLFDSSRDAHFPGTADGFEIVRKPTDQVLACRRIVWDNDRQPKELAAKLGDKFRPRWYAAPDAQDKWKGDDTRMPRAFGHKDPDEHWLRYQHLAWVTDPITGHPRQWTWNDLPAEPAAGPVDNFLAYNEGWSEGVGGRDASAESLWVGDLIVECEAELADGAAGVTLELSKGQNRFRAAFAGGEVALSSTGPGGRDLARRPCKVAGPGKYRLRFANVDCRLRVWVDDKLVDFGADGDYPPESTVPPGAADGEGFAQENDVAAPAGIGARGGVEVRAIRLHRDVYYTRRGVDRSGRDHAAADLFYVQPGHYLCLGDNSAQSSDSREWGTVPDRLMLGKAVFVFWPGPVESTGPALWQFRLNLGMNRIGFIK